MDFFQTIFFQSKIEITVCVLYLFIFLGSSWFQKWHWKYLEIRYGNSKSKKTKVNFWSRGFSREISYFFISFEVTSAVTSSIFEPSFSNQLSWIQFESGNLELTKSELHQLYFEETFAFFWKVFWRRTSEIGAKLPTLHIF